LEIKKEIANEKEMIKMSKNKLQAKCNMLQPKSEANPRRPDYKNLKPKIL
jgi:hypothetical protein